MKKILYVILSLIIVSDAFAQDHFTYFCGQAAAQEKLFQQHPGTSEAARRAEQELEEHTANFGEDRSGIVYIIPVVFHVIHQSGVENITDEQIYDAMAVLNADFRKQNADTSVIVAAFVDIAADCEIDFSLATRDPNGACHNGINRISSDLTFDGFNSDMKALSYWPRNKYLNIWVCNTIGDNTAGFSNLPSSVASAWAASEDGIVIRSNYVGTIGTGSVGRSRTLTHEVGHWLNLKHTWGNGNTPGDIVNCDQNDGVADTPNTIGYTSCQLSGASCGSVVDNVQNYMEYSYCSKMFTEGQSTRMRAALTSSTAQRNQLWTNANLIATGVINPPLCLAQFSADKQSGCMGETIQFSDHSYNGISTWSWDFGDGTTLSGTDPLVHKNPTHIYQTPGVYTVALVVGNGTGQLNTTINSYITIFDNGMIAPPLVEGFEGVWPNSNWLGFNPDADETWEITPSAQYSGIKSLKLRNFSVEVGNVDQLYTATFDMTGADTIYLGYKWAYANRATITDDQFRISVSGDCGNTWIVRKLRKGTTNLPTATATDSQFTPTSLTDWGSEVILLNNSDWYNDRFRVKFEFTGLGGNNFYLDDINIYASGPTISVHEAKPVFLFNVYPNPSSGNMTLELGQVKSEMITVELYNSTGQLCDVVFRGMANAGRQNITIPDQPGGLYNLVIKKDGHMAVQKLIFE